MSQLRLPSGCALTSGTVGRGGSRHRGPSTAEGDEFGDLLALTQDLLLDAVGATLESDSPDPARDRIERIVEIDDEIAVLDSGPPPGATFTLVVLAGWLSRWGRSGTVRPDPEAVLGWIAHHLGARYRARARYLVGMLEPGQAHEVVHAYAEALGDDFLPTLIWIAAALTALYGEGDPDWLVDKTATLH